MAQPPTLHSAEFGDPSRGDVVVLLGSIATTHEIWEKQIPALARDHRVIALDHLGHGRSPRSGAAPGETTIDDLASAVLSTLDGLGVERFTVVGLSLGGALAQYLAATSPRVERAVICATATFLGGEERWRERTAIAREQGVQALADGMVENWFTGPFRAAHPDDVERVRQMILGIDPEGFAQNGDALATWDFAARLPEITVPVLTVAGKDDPSTGPDELQKIAAGVSGPVDSVVLEPGSHQVAVENPGEFNEVLLEFLRR